MSKLDLTKVKLELIPLIEKGMSSYAIAKHLDLSPTTIRYRLKKCGLKTKLYLKKDNSFLKCLECGTSIQYPKISFCCKKHKNLYHAKQFAKNNYKKQNEKGKRIRLHFIQKLGGKCNFCSYDENYACLVFHHKDSSTKIFNIDMRHCANNNLQKLEDEVSKCILLCANCHTALHNPLYINPKYLL